MKYVNKLTDEQIKELANIWYEDTEEKILKIELSSFRKGLSIIISLECGIVDELVFKDYRVLIYDFYDYKEHEHIIQYRKKMLEYFGEQYAIDYLLGE